MVTSLTRGLCLSIKQVRLYDEEFITWLFWHRPVYQALGRYQPRADIDAQARYTGRYQNNRLIKVKQMIYIAVLCNPKITTEPLYNTPFIGPYAAANNTALLAWRPSQGTKLYCLVNRGTLGVNNLPRVVSRIMPRSESNPRPLDHESNALPLHHRVTFKTRHTPWEA